MKVALIVAMDVENGIGKNNDLMWHLPADMKFFKETTQGHIVVMGRKNFESIPERFRPLPNRENAILTRNKSLTAEGCAVFHDYNDCLNHYAQSDKTVYIIGGGEIYNIALSNGNVDELLITHVDKKYDADTFFPKLNSDEWLIEDLKSHPKDEKNEASFTIKRYSKKK